MASVRSRPPGALEFALPGSWARVDVAGPMDKAVLRREVEKLVGRRDDLATERDRLVRVLESVIESRPENLEMLLFCAEIEKGTPFPIVVAVFGTDDLHMSPAVGTEPAVVLEVLKRGRAKLYGESDQDWGEVTTRTGKALRTSQVADMRVHPSSDEVVVPALVATYWVTVPDSKFLMAVTFYTPMVDIANLALRYFDAIIRATRYIRAAVD